MSPDALEVMWVSYLLSISTDLTDVTLVSEDTRGRVDDDENYEDEDDEENENEKSYESWNSQRNENEG